MSDWTCPFCGSKHDGESPFDAGDAYRVAMLEHGYVYPSPPWGRKTSDKRVLQCGLVHEFNWSEWRTYSDGGRRYEGRWCQTCATTQAREMP